MITSGSKVQLTNRKSIAHFESVGMSIVGTVARVDQANFVGNHHRPYLVEFDDRPGQWGYSINEIRKLG